MISLMLEGGLKVSELVGREEEQGPLICGGLRLGDVDLRGGQIAVHKRKTGASRRIVVSPVVRTLLARWIAVRPRTDSDLLFTTRQGRCITNRYVRMFLGDYAARAGIAGRVKPSMLRHTFAGRLYRQTGDLQLVQELLGHLHIASTARYAHTGESEGGRPPAPVRKHR